MKSSVTAAEPVEVSRRIAMGAVQTKLDQGKVEEFFGKVVQDVAATLHAGLVLVLNSDTHAPGDIWPAARLHEIVVGAGLTADDYHTMMKNAESIANRCLT